MTALSPPFSPMQKRNRGNKWNGYNQVFHKKRKYKNNWISALYKKSDETNIKGGSDWLHENKGTPPPLQKYKSSIDIYQNHRTSQKIYI